jgi:hypothetical protein
MTARYRFRVLPSLRAFVLVLALTAGLVVAPAQAHDADRKSKPARPEVYKVRPASGDDDGGTEVILRGKYFSRTKQVLFGTTPATEFEVLSDKKLRVVSPAHAEGLIRIWVTTKVGRARAGAFDGFRYIDTTVPPPPAPLGPTVTGLSPGQGTVFGGTTVTITGTNLTGTTVVEFGTSIATSVTVDSPTSITVETPSHALGTVDVTVTTPAGTSANTTADDFTYDLFD